MFCPYCGKDKPEADFTDEHVVPQRLGGNLTPINPFVIRSGKPCNTTAGRWVDGPFIRSWFVMNDRAMHALKYVDISAANSIVPYVYIGYIDGLRWEG